MLPPHPELELLLAADRGEVPKREVRLRHRRHRDALCRECGFRTSLFEAVLRDDLRTDPAARQRCYADVADGTVDLATAFALDRPDVDSELEVLRTVAPRRLAERIRRSAWPRFRSPLLVEAMIQEARARLHHDGRQALHWLAGARAVVVRAETEVNGREGYAPIRDLRIRVRAHEGNALRVLGDLRAADAVFVAIRRRLAASEAPAIVVSAELASFEASLRYDQRRLVEADALLERAAKFFRWAEDDAGLAKVLVKRGMVLYMGGDPARAAPCYEAALAAAGAEDDPRTALSAQHNLVLCLCDLGRGEQARSVIEAARQLYLRLGDPTTLNLLAWAEGKVAAALGDDPTALELLGRARASCMERQLEFDAALVTLDLAEVHLRRGETGEVRRLAEWMVNVFSELGVDQEAVRAVGLFAQAALAEAVTLEVIARTRTALLRAHRPSTTAEV